MSEGNVVRMAGFQRPVVGVRERQEGGVGDHLELDVE